MVLTSDVGVVGSDLGHLLRLATPTPGQRAHVVRTEPFDAAVVLQRENVVAVAAEDGLDIVGVDDGLDPRAAVLLVLVAVASPERTCPSVATGEDPPVLLEDHRVAVAAIHEGVVVP